MVQKYQSPVRVYKYPFELVMTVSAGLLTFSNNPISRLPSNRANCQMVQIVHRTIWTPTPTHSPNNKAMHPNSHNSQRHSVGIRDISKCYESINLLLWHCATCVYLLQCSKHTQQQLTSQCLFLASPDQMNGFCWEAKKKTERKKTTNCQQWQCQYTDIYRIQFPNKQKQNKHWDEDVNHDDDDEKNKKLFRPNTRHWQSSLGCL